MDLNNIKDKITELTTQFIEMGQLKSEFDMEKFTVKKEGNFIAHEFHFLMRQYHLALYEANRMLIDKEEKMRLLSEYINDDSNKVKVLTDKGYEEKYRDLEIKRVENEIFMLDIGLANKIPMCEYFEKLRIKLIEFNNGKIPSNTQYQEEEPEYWKWFIQKKALAQFKERQTGISEGTWEAIDHMEESPVINEKYQFHIGSKFDVDKIEEEIQKQKQLNFRDYNKLISNQ